MGTLPENLQLAPSQKLPLLSKIRIALTVSVHSLKSIIPERTSAGGVLSVMLCAHANSETSHTVVVAKLCQNLALPLLVPISAQGQMPKSKKFGKKPCSSFSGCLRYL